MKITVRYFALMREAAGRDGEALDTLASTPRALYAELQARHAFPLHAEQLLVAINDAFAGMDTALVEGDGVVFIQPVAGG